MYQCTYEECDSTFKKKWRLVEHMVKHTGEKPFRCAEVGCGKSFGRKSHLQRHQKNHLPDKDFQCPEEGCTDQFVSKETLSHHLKRVHMEKPFKCVWPDCGKSFKKHQHLKSHAAQHDGTLPHVCDHEGCTKAFLVPSKLRAHKKTHEGYTCEVAGCGVVVYKWTDMRRHKSDAHRRSFPCDKCDRTFKTDAKLRYHAKVHDAEREVFECPHADCTRLYTRVSYLQQHVLNYHEGARPYACSHPGCVKTFAYKRSMQEHKVVHEPGYCKPPSNPKRKRSLASRLSGFPDAATYNIGRVKPDGKVRRTGADKPRREVKPALGGSQDLSSGADMGNEGDGGSMEEGIAMRVTGSAEREAEETKKISKKATSSMEENGYFMNEFFGNCSSQGRPAITQNLQHGDMDGRCEGSPIVTDAEGGGKCQTGAASAVEHELKTDVASGSMTNAPVVWADVLGDYEQIEVVDMGTSLSGSLGAFVSVSSDWISSGTDTPLLDMYGSQASRGDQGLCASGKLAAVSGGEAEENGGLNETASRMSKQIELNRSDLNRNDLGGTVDSLVEHSTRSANEESSTEKSQLATEERGQWDTLGALKDSHDELQQRRGLEAEVSDELDGVKKLLSLSCPITDRLNM